MKKHEVLLEQFEVFVSDMLKHRKAEDIDHVKVKPHYFEALKEYTGHFKESGYPKWDGGGMWWAILNTETLESTDIKIVKSEDFHRLYAFVTVPKAKEFPIEGVLMEKRSLMPSSEGCMIREERYHTVERHWQSEGSAVILFALNEGERFERYHVTDGQEAERILEEYKETGKITLKNWYRVEEVTFSPVFVSLLKEADTYHKVERVRVVDTTAKGVTLEKEEGAGNTHDRTNDNGREGAMDGGDG